MKVRSADTTRRGIPGVHIVVSGLFTLPGTVKTLPIQTPLSRSHVAWKEPDPEGSHGVKLQSVSMEGRLELDLTLSSETSPTFRRTALRGSRGSRQPCQFEQLWWWLGMGGRAGFQKVLQRFFAPCLGSMEADKGILGSGRDRARSGR